MNCNYCGRPAECVTGQELYPHRPDLSSKRFWRCTPCGAYVGCHHKTTRPLGLLANAETRRLRQQAHACFDPLWNGATAIMSRTKAYKWLRSELGLTETNCHIGMFTVEQCQAAIDAVAARFSQKKIPIFLTSATDLDNAGIDSGEDPTYGHGHEGDDCPS